MSLTLVPAYGRDYKSAAAVKEDWEANKDFQVAGIGGSGYVNKADLEANAGDNGGRPEQVMIRYNKLTRVVMIG